MKQLFIALCSVIATHIYAQDGNGIGIGTTNVDPSAILEISSKNKGLLAPRLTTDERIAMVVTNNSEGVFCYDTDLQAYYFYNGESWEAVGTPQGGIIMWSGNPKVVPKGWALCDGRNGTPNLSGRFIVGYDSTTVSAPAQVTDLTLNYGTVGNTGGKDKVTLSANESGLPAHDHDITHTHTLHNGKHSHEFHERENKTFGSGNGKDGVNRTYRDEPNQTTSEVNIYMDGHTGESGQTGGNSAIGAHENRPAYYVLAYIIKL